MSLYWRRIGRQTSKDGYHRVYISVGLITGYTVGKVASGEWYYEGHGLDGVAETSRQAKAACEANVKRTDTP